MYCVFVSAPNEYYLMSGSPKSPSVDAEDDAVYVNGPQLTASVNRTEEMPALVVHYAFLQFVKFLCVYTSIGRICSVHSGRAVCLSVIGH